MRSTSEHDLSVEPEALATRAVGDDFVRFVTGLGRPVDPLRDPWAFLYFVRDHRIEIESQPALLSSAAAYLDEVLRSEVPDPGLTAAVEAASPASRRSDNNADTETLLRNMLVVGVEYLDDFAGILRERRG